MEFINFHSVRHLWLNTHTFLDKHMYPFWSSRVFLDNDGVKVVYFDYQYPYEYLYLMDT
jgi:hypothetical protein